MNSTNPLKIVKIKPLFIQKYLAVFTSCKITEDETWSSVSILDTEKELDVLRYQQTFKFTDLSAEQTHKIENLVDVSLVARNTAREQNLTNQVIDVSGYSYFNFYAHLAEKFDYLEDYDTAKTRRIPFLSHGKYWILVISIGKDFNVDGGSNSKAKL